MGNHFALACLVKSAMVLCLVKSAMVLCLVKSAMVLCLVKSAMVLITSGQVQILSNRFCDSFRINTFCLETYVMMTDISSEYYQFTAQLKMHIK